MQGDLLVGSLAIMPRRPSQCDNRVVMRDETARASSPIHVRAAETERKVLVRYAVIRGGEAGIPGSE